MEEEEEEHQEGAASQTPRAMSTMRSEVTDGRTGSCVADLASNTLCRWCWRKEHRCLTATEPGKGGRGCPGETSSGRGEPQVWKDGREMSVMEGAGEGFHRQQEAEKTGVNVGSAAHGRWDRPSLGTLAALGRKRVHLPLCEDWEAAGLPALAHAAEGSYKRQRSGYSV